MKKNQYYSIADCSRLLGVAEHRINYAHRTGKLPEPHLRIGGCRAYSGTEVKNLCQYFGAALDSASKGQFVTQTALGKRIGLSFDAIENLLVKIGLRNPDKSPSEKAIDGGFVMDMHDDRGVSFPGWHLKKTIAALEAVFPSLGGVQKPESKEGT